VKALAVIIFCFTYALIAARRLRVLPIGRPAGGLLGAVLMVACGVLSPEESFAAIDHDTIVLLLGMMLITAYLDQAAFFDWVVSGVLRVCRSPWALLVIAAVLSAVLSALLVNDTVCLFMTPVVVATCARAKLPMGPYLLAVATSSNIGSAATLVGNPQNMIIGSPRFSGMPFGEFLLRSGTAALVGLALNVALLWLYYGRRLPAAMPAVDEAPAREAKRGDLGRVSIIIAAVVVGFFAGGHLGYTALAGAVALIVLERAEPRQAFARVDWALLVFFCSLFIVVRGLASTGLVAQAFEAARPFLDLERPQGVAAFCAVVIVGSNLVSNVPLVMLAGPYMKDIGGAQPELGWVLLAFVSTIAGNLTLIGSVANIIVAEGAKDHYTLGFVEYLKFGLVSTLLVLAAGVPVIWIVTRSLG
jgi:Na+/H+ antiporter NhaD/arsenite permease-like protein